MDPEDQLDRQVGEERKRARRAENSKAGWVVIAVILGMVLVVMCTNLQDQRAEMRAQQVQIERLRDPYGLTRQEKCDLIIAAERRLGATASTRAQLARLGC